MANPETESGFPFDGDRDEMEAWIARRAEADPAFREALLADSRTAIAEALGKTPPASVTITIVPEGPDELIVVQRFRGALGLKKPKPSKDKYVKFTRALAKLQVFDREFRDDLETRKGHGAFSKKLGLTVDPSVTIRRLRETKDQVYVVLRNPAHFGAWEPPADPPDEEPPA
ncbi:MAG TPA: hypothetical protein VF432_02890 [Thermoanaerobaculia bacterium]